MTVLELMTDVLERNFGLMEMTLGDFTDAEMVVRPVAGANHAIWQLGHLAKSTAYFASVIPGVKAPVVPENWKEVFGKSGAKVDDAKAFPTKGELLKSIKESKDAIVAGVKKLKIEDLAKAAPAEVQAFAPTVGHAILIVGSHWTMHVGQFQVIRRKLGKPILF